MALAFTVKRFFERLDVVEYEHGLIEIWQSGGSGEKNFVLSIARDDCYLADKLNDLSELVRRLQEVVDRMRVGRTAMEEGK